MHCMYVYMQKVKRTILRKYECKGKQYHHCELFDGTACSHGIGAFLNQVSRMNADDVHTKKLVGVLVIQNLQ